MANYWVNNDTGNDAASGDQAHPWETIAHALATVAAGDVIRLVNTGIVYTEFALDCSAVGTASNRYTICGDDPTDPPNMNLQPFILDGEYWTIRDLLWDDHDDWAIQIGDDATGDTGKHISIINCTFQHSHHQGIEIFYGENIAIIRCLFLDLRSKVAESDLDAVDFRRYAKDVLFSECVFEGIGSDGIHIFPTAPHVDDFLGRVDVERCRFIRPYPYADWAYYDAAFGSVGENGLDIKRAASADGYGPVNIRNCVFCGFIEIANGADCSDGDGGGHGDAIVVHDGSDVVNIQNCVITGHNNYGVQLSGSDITYPGAACWIEQTTIADCDHAAIRLLDGTLLTLTNSTLSGCAKSLDSHETPTTANHNLIVDCPSYTLSVGGGEVQTFDHNRWEGTSTKPAGWNNSDSDPA